MSPEQFGIDLTYFPSFNINLDLHCVFSSICWWVFSALVATTRTLRLRRNVVKLALYRHFANTLVLSVIASVVFMMWNIKFHRLEECLKGAYYHGNNRVFFR